jgi:hypothetical protein
MIKPGDKIRILVDNANCTSEEAGAILVVTEIEDNIFRTTVSSPQSLHSRWSFGYNDLGTLFELVVPENTTEPEPIKLSDFIGSATFDSFNGLSRRDYFAAAAMQEMLASPFRRPENWLLSVLVAVSAADNLIEELDKK